MFCKLFFTIRRLILTRKKALPRILRKGGVIWRAAENQLTFRMWLVSRELDNSGVQYNRGYMFQPYYTVIRRCLQEFIAVLSTITTLMVSIQTKYIVRVYITLHFNKECSKFVFRKESERKEND
jgi:hypothetical protein